MSRQMVDLLPLVIAAVVIFLRNELARKVCIAVFAFYGVCVAFEQSHAILRSSSGTHAVHAGEGYYVGYKNAAILAGNYRLFFISNYLALAALGLAGNGSRRASRSHPETKDP